ncbi:MAG TPA: nucleotidyltransferase domain-containing protein [Phycisphaerales bacterium]|nr:nucleotidyltransferase domain-containing protein [Phycisphaerales bacterium]
MLRDEIIAKVRPELTVLSEKYAVQEVYLFGSVARGEERPESDVDFAIVFDKTRTVTLSTLGALKDHLTDLIGREADIGERAFIRPFARADAESDMIRIE